MGETDAATSDDGETASLLPWILLIIVIVMVAFMGMSVISLYMRRKNLILQRERELIKMVSPSEKPEHVRRVTRSSMVSKPSMIDVDPGAEGRAEGMQGMATGVGSEQKVPNEDEIAFLDFVEVQDGIRSTFESEACPTTTQRGSVTLGADDSVLNILQRAMAYGAVWDNGLFAADMEIDEKELEKLYSENEAVERHSGMEMMRPELAEYEYYINHLDELAKVNHLQIECNDTNCGWNHNVPLLPQQVIHVMIYHRKGTYI